jgi:hypothetical protein
MAFNNEIESDKKNALASKGEIDNGLSGTDTTMPSAEQPADMLPETGTSLLLIGLLGTSAIAMSLGMWAIRRTCTIDVLPNGPSGGD